MQTDDVHKYLKGKGWTSVAKCAKDLASNSSPIQSIFNQLESIGILESRKINSVTYYKLKR